MSPNPHFLFTFLVSLPLLSNPALADDPAEPVAHGSVFEDANGNGVRDDGEKGLAGIAVSNQREVVQTDAEGNWALPYDDDTVFFVIKPRGWATALGHHQLPEFYYVHKPAGSPKSRYPGVAPTGKLPESVDFPLTKQEEPERFQAILFGDPQPSSQDEVDYIAHDVIAELIGTDAKFGVTLGDIMFDKLELFEPSNANIALIGIPWYNVIGNHDMNTDSDTDKDSDETFTRHFGPNYYSFDYGPVHFVVLDDVEWAHKNQKGQKIYKGGLDADQIEFVKNDLALVPEERLVMLMMHIPLLNVGNRAELFRLIEKRPHTLSVSGHTHWQAHQYIGENDGWMGEEPHHYIITVTVSGTWWKGAKDEQGIPHATMRDGAPNGYGIVTFDGTSAKYEFKAARQPADYQLHVFAPDEVAVGKSETVAIYVNVFNGSEKSEVKMRVGEDAEWITLEKTEEADPHYVAVRIREIAKDPEGKRHLSGPVMSAHLWKAKLPAGLKVGSQLIEVKATDDNGTWHQGKRVIRVVE
jgi:hypothetical protein